MEVTRENFQEVLREIDEVLPNATFLGIDGEFTGLNSGPEAKAFDTPSQYYLKLRSGSMDFLLVQFGLSIFSYEAKTNKYLQRSYSFYVFPKPLNKSAPDSRFMCQASSIAFLVNQGFDFNKLFKSGISYLTTSEEEKLCKRLEDKQKIREDGLELIPISLEDKPHLDEICTKIDEFLASDAEELLIERCNGYIRRIVHQEVRQRWPSKIRLESRVEGSLQSLIVHKMGTKEEEENKSKERYEKEQQEMRDAVGLSALLRKIADSGKLIVGHNMLLDLCHVIHKFFGPLPESYREFKSLVHGLFPRLIDTKVLSSMPPFKDLIPSSILHHLFETLGKSPFTMPEVIPVENRSYSMGDEIYHEAGYDAYITGLCFIIMANYLGATQTSKVDKALPDSPLLNSYLNKLLIVRLKDFPYINLVGDDPKVSREHVYHVTFPKNWKMSNISQVFSPYGGVFVSWLTDTTAYVGLHRREQSVALNKRLKKNNHLGECHIQSYTKHQASLDNSKSNEYALPQVNNEADRKRKKPATEPSTITKDTQEAEAESDGWEYAAGKRRRKRKGAVTGNGKDDKAGEKKAFTEEASWD